MMSNPLALAQQNNAPGNAYQSNTSGGAAASATNNSDQSQ